MEPRCCLRTSFLITTVVAAVYCCAGVRGLLATEEHFDVPLKDRFGRAMTPESTEPYSPRQTCGGCHDVDHMANGYHFQQGRTDSDGNIIVRDDYFGDGRRFVRSPGMYGKW